MNSKWDVSGTIKNNKNKVRKAVYAAYSFLRRTDVLTALKIKFINSVLLPIGCYGGEKFGMSEARCKPIKSEIDKAIRMVANVGKSAAMERIRDELGITSVFMRTSTARERAYHKWPTSKTWIADLIKAPMKARMVTWLQPLGKSPIYDDRPVHTDADQLWQIFYTFEFQRSPVGTNWKTPWG
ncbi:hypothetical protein AYI69_g7351 [Smittium culicis]|uniref:Uncharacterized protein n=1 Tax=Smittium culicis TaxID=133412 RepID=A0A1R1XSJ2_9FUNG|nr:hypothetical protein AYI69_g7351 [Smittium culicis]